jgi:hypothetical protein
MSKKTPTQKKHRSAITGQYITEDHAKKHPKTTVTETNKTKKSK